MKEREILQTAARFCFVHLGLLLLFLDPMNVLPEPKTGKHTKLEPKPQPRVSSRKTSNSPSKKDKNSSTSTCEPREAAERQVASEEATSPEKCQPSSRFSHEHKVFQRTLSPADVLHVHSYAKGDYGEGEIQSKEDRSESSVIKTERDKRLSKSVNVIFHTSSADTLITSLTTTDCFLSYSFHSLVHTGPGLQTCLSGTSTNSYFSSPAGGRRGDHR